jgi:tetraacyldisaccharide 4'-kinase
LYGIIIWVRNALFDKKIFKSASFNFPLICVGNLAIGGTGKTPMTEFIVNALKTKYKIATLSRGYKRRTKGFFIAIEGTTALEIGDEPMQFHQKFPEIVVAVGEERLFAIPQILYQKPETQVIVLDDAFQHRRVTAGLNIILTECNNLFTRDFLFPSGDLRDIRSSYKRAVIIIVTKCKNDLTEKEREKIIQEINPQNGQKVYFSTLKYDTPYHLFTKEITTLDRSKDVLLICGIANPEPLKMYLMNHVHYYEMTKYADHHIFTSTDLKEIMRQFEKIKSEQKIIITTEKDSVRLEKFKNELIEFPIYVLPIQHEILFNENDDFINKLTSFIEKYPPQKRD